MRYYLDSPPIIYLVEQVQPYATAVRGKLSAPGLTLITSELTRLECRVIARKQANAELAAANTKLQAAEYHRLAQLPLTTFCPLHLWIDATNIVVMAIVLLILAIVSFIAILTPALRARKINPIQEVRAC